MKPKQPEKPDDKSRYESALRDAFAEINTRINGPYSLQFCQGMQLAKLVVLEAIQKVNKDFKGE